MNADGSIEVDAIESIPTNKVVVAEIDFTVSFPDYSDFTEYDSQVYTASFMFGAISWDEATSNY